MSTSENLIPMSLLSVLAIYQLQVIIVIVARKLVICCQHNKPINLLYVIKIMPNLVT
jgi:hypothetical protein